MWIYATKFIILKNIMLRERSQTQSATCCMILFTWNVQKRHICRNIFKANQCLSRAGGGNGCKQAARIFGVMKMS